MLYTCCLSTGGLYGYLSQPGCTENDPSYRLHPEERSAAELRWWEQEEEEETTSHKTVWPWCNKVPQCWYKIGKWQWRNLLMWFYSGLCTNLKLHLLTSWKLLRPSTFLLPMMGRNDVGEYTLFPLPLQWWRKKGRNVQVVHSSFLSVRCIPESMQWLTSSLRSNRR